MPSFDGTGPQGGGPFTGGGNGFCVVRVSEEQEQPEAVGHRPTPSVNRNRFGFGCRRRPIPRACATPANIDPESLHSEALGVEGFAPEEQLRSLGGER
jgi:hypothetical protein